MDNTGHGKFPYFYNMVKVVIIGFGNVGSHLYQICEATKDIEVLQVYARSAPDDIGDTIVTTDLKKISRTADIYIAAIPDDEIYNITSKLPFSDKLVVHTSGAATIESVHKKNRQGVFYPLQTFSKNKVVNFNNIPICIEATHKEDLTLLLEMGYKISEKVQPINFEERSKLHVAAVFVNNFVNELYHISEDILKKHQLDLTLLQPLIKETAQKVASLSPALAQTGPAKRGDQKTIDKHQELLNTQQKNVYKVLTESIQQRTIKDE